jgi:histidinol-phosphate/aromatic aminotransferase/cobyric acid decarboxylase-like protein
LAERVHGGVDASELARCGLAPAQLLDLSVNVNPWGPHPDVLAAIQRAPVACYPQPSAAEARAAIATSCARPIEEVLVGHGSAELLWAAVRALAPSRRPLIVLRPTFSEPEHAAAASGMPLVALQSGRFQIDLDQLSHAIRKHAAAGVYLCQPNNPDGGALPAEQLAALFAAHPECTFILDQAFLSLSTRHLDASLRYAENVLLVRSLTKDHALPGVRAGYALAAPGWIARLAAQRPSWMVSTLADAAIRTACQHGDYVREVRERLLRAKAELADGCRALGLEVSDSVTHFFLLRVGDAGADALRERLLRRHGIAVRSCTSFGLPRHIRVAGCEEPARSRFLHALRAELRP